MQIPITTINVRVLVESCSVMNDSLLIQSLKNFMKKKNEKLFVELAV